MTLPPVVSLIKIQPHICLELFRTVNSAWSVQISLLIQTRTLFHWRKRYYGLWTRILVENVLMLDLVWRLQRVLPQVPSTDSESSWEDRWCLSPLPPGHLQHPSHPQSPQHCRWSHPPDTQLLQSATIREETEESPSQDKQTERQLHPPGCQEAELPPVLAPPPLSYPTNHWTLTPTTTHTNTHTHTHTHTHTLSHTLTLSHSHWDKHRSLVEHWTDLIQLPLLTVWTKKTAPCHFK